MAASVGGVAQGGVRLTNPFTSFVYTGFTENVAQHECSTHIHKELLPYKFS